MNDKSYPILIIDMRPNLVLLVKAVWRLRLDMQIRRNEPVSGAHTVTMFIVDVELQGSGIRELSTSHTISIDRYHARIGRNKPS